MRLTLMICLWIGVANAMVDFTSSALYDIYDFKGEDEVFIPKCDSGCLIYAATMGEGFVQYPDNLDPYASSLYIWDEYQGRKISIAQLAQQRDSQNKKIPLTITGRSNISVVNYNDINEYVYWSIVLYVVEKTKAEEFSYEVYDSAYAHNKITPQSDIVTIMSAYDFRVHAEPTAQPNSITASLVGFDNALDDNKDGCTYAYKISDEKSFPGFTIMTKSPIISLLKGKRTAIELTIDSQFRNTRDIAVDGFISSPGWNGCTKPNNGGIQTFRTPDALTTDEYILSNSDESTTVDKFIVSMTAYPNFDAKHNLTITQANSFGSTEVTGTSPQQLRFPNARLITIDFQNMKGDQGFLLRYSSTGPSKWTTTLPTTATSTAQLSRTTTTSNAATENSTNSNYCNCGIVDGWLDNWDANEIWVDLVVILDTSASMGESLEEAKSVLTSFIALMSTDTAAEFYSRIGVIAVSDTTEVIYNLNMSSSDTLDSVKQHKIDKIDVGAAFQAALTMFADGTTRASYRENAKQIVYYLTTSAPGSNMNGVDDFKTAGGIIIVNDFVLEGEVADPSLKKLASENFFFTDLSEDYLNNLQVICEANCFCNPSKHAFNDDDNSPRTGANRGCFHPVNNGIPQPKARETCQKEGAYLVSIHDQDKEFFVSSVASIFGAKKKYWLGLENDGSKWNWDDKSTDSYSDWDINQPNTNGGQLTCAYATQTTGLNVRWTAANCAMGGVIYVCESAPCSRGNTNC